MSRKLHMREDRVEINQEFTSLDQFIKEYVSNVSRSGAFVRSKDPLPVGTRVNLRFTIFAEELEVIEGIGQVVRVQQRPRGMGIVFVKLTHHSQELINKLIVRQMIGSRDPDHLGEAPKPRKSAGRKPPPPPGKKTR